MLGLRPAFLRHIERIIKREKELGNVEYDNTCITLFKPPSTYDMCKVETCIDNGLLFDVAKLIWVEEVIRSDIELKPGANNFLNEFFCSVEQNNGSERFGYII